MRKRARPKPSALLGPPVEDADQPCIEGGDPGRFLRWGNLLTMSDAGSFRSFIYGLYFSGDAAPVEARTTAGAGSKCRPPSIARSTETVSLLESRARDSRAARRGNSRSTAICFGQSQEGLGGFLEGDLETGIVVTIVGGALCPQIRLPTLGKTIGDS
jgi:hypothetical protein